MKSFCRSMSFKGSLAVGLLAAGLSSSGIIARAQSFEVAAADQSPPAPAVTYPAGISDILKLVDAKLDVEIIKAYIKGAPFAYHLNASDIIALKDRGVPSDVITAILQHGAEVSSQGVMPGPYASVPPPTPYPTYPYSANPYTEFDASGSPVYAYPADYSGYGYPYYSQGYPWYYNYWYNYCRPVAWPYFSFGFFGDRFHRFHDHDFDRFHHFRDFDRFHRFNNFDRFHRFDGSHSPFARPGMTAGTFSQPGFNNRAGFPAGRMAAPRTFASAPRAGSFAPRCGFAMRGGGGGSRGGGFSGGHR